MTLQEQIAVMQAYADGKPVEFTNKHQLGPWAKCGDDVTWNWSIYTYRIAISDLNSAGYTIVRKDDDWPPIETAPKDGEPFLAYWWREHTNGERYEAAQPYVVAHYMGERLFPSWITEDDLPTHWRPLPAPPSTRSLKRREGMKTLNPDEFKLIKTALEHASFALDGVVAMDEEDELPNGDSETCQHAKKTVDRALKTLMRGVA